MEARIALDVDPQVLISPLGLAGPEVCVVLSLEWVWPIQEEKFEQDLDEDRLESLYKKLGKECGRDIRRSTASSPRATNRGALMSADPDRHHVIQVGRKGHTTS